MLSFIKYPTVKSLKARQFFPQACTSQLLCVCSVRIKDSLIQDLGPKLSIRTSYTINLFAYRSFLNAPSSTLKTCYGVETCRIVK